MRLRSACPLDRALGAPRPRAPSSALALLALIAAAGCATGVESPPSPEPAALAVLLPAAAPPPPRPVALALGERTTCVTRSDGRTTCAGALSLPGVDLAGRLEVTDTDVCARTPGHARCLHPGADRELLTPFLEVVRGPGTPCGRATDGAVYCFLPDSPDETVADLVPVPLPGPATALGADGARVYALVADGTLWAWSPEGHGGDPAPARVAEHVALVDSEPWTRLCAAQPDAVRCWATGRAEPRRRIRGVTAVAVGRAHVCVLAGGGVSCWGDDRSGQASPPPLAAPVALDAGDDHTCAIDAGEVVCWGADDRRQGSSLGRP